MDHMYEAVEFFKDRVKDSLVGYFTASEVVVLSELQQTNREEKELAKECLLRNFMDHKEKEDASEAYSRLINTLRHKLNKITDIQAYVTLEMLEEFRKSSEDVQFSFAAMQYEAEQIFNVKR